MTEIDLAFNPLQPRDPDGKWVRVGLAKALKAAPPGSTFESKAGPNLFQKVMEGEAGDKESVTFTSDLNGNWQGPDNWGKPLSSDAMAKTFSHGLIRTPDDQRVHRSRVQGKRDLALLQKKSDKVKAAEQKAYEKNDWVKFKQQKKSDKAVAAVERRQTKTLEAKAKRDAFANQGKSLSELTDIEALTRPTAIQKIQQQLKDYFNGTGDFSPDDDKANPFRMPTRPGETVYKPHRPGWQLATPPHEREIDLDWTEWNRTHRKNGTAPAKGEKRAPARGNKRAQSEIERFKEAAGVGNSTNAKLGPKAMAELKRRAQMAGHLRAKAILAAAKGHTAKANKIEQARQAKRRARRLAAGL